ncbi:pyridoxal 5'-phosphate synthase glutaminase subunit PdxT [candidate division KSB1 bacterium]|nr:pyridoxal 5'-phosphate synthase glutaminase subunit PdxT [candidate division KSB1 bacterium]RQW10792.1 MAG: pyridoxal 5'-phosphate synthase glutaminase subunit PdxT [candidate division KSB1 bacterium]
MVAVGILALQGDFDRHARAIQALGQRSILVRAQEHLSQCDGLIIPGGESTTLIKLLKEHAMWDALSAFAATRPIYGTCAGCILVANSIVGMDQDSLKLIDIDVQRNAYGRQVDSFIDDITIQLNGKAEKMEGVFIRAPKIRRLGVTVTPLGWHGSDVILAEQDRVLVGTFHPELTDDRRVHDYFLRKIKANQTR